MLHGPEPCPESTSTHTIDTVYKEIQTQGDPAGIKLVKSVMSNQSSIIDTKKSFVEMIDMCDSIKTEFETKNTFDLAHKDSISEGIITVDVEKNKVISFKTDFKYSLLQVHDSIFIHDAPKKCFTLGLFGGKSSGIDLGYRWSDKQVSVGYDVLNKGIVGRFNLDLK